MGISNMPSDKGDREYTKFIETVINGTTYSGVVVSGNLTASVAIGDTVSVRNANYADLQAEVYQSTASNLKMIDVGGGGGGGNTLYQSPEDFNAAYSSPTVLAISGMNYTPDVEQCVKVTEFPASGAASIYTPATNNFAYDASSDALTVTNASFSSTSDFRVEFVGPDKAYSAASDANQVYDINPDTEKYSGETLGSETDVATGSTYNYYVDMAGYKHCAFQYEKGGTASTLRFSVDATLQDDGTAASSCTYQDVDANGHTNISGTTTDSYTSDAYIIMKPEMNAKYYKATVEQSGTYTTMDFDLYCRRWN
jgi:hypothetical protein